jgi:hypothetical protein
MIDEDDLEVNCFNYFHFEVGFVRMIEDLLVPTKMRVRAEFIPLDEASEHEIDRAFEKIRFWLDNILDGAIVFAQSNATAIKMIFDDAGTKPMISNVLMLTPFEPTDQHMAPLLQAKLQALSGLSMAFGAMRIETGNQLGVSFDFVGDSSAVLPDADEWFDTRRYFDEPWWDRDDGSTLDTVPPDDADLSVRPAYAFTFDFLDQKRPTASNGAIVRHNFRPTVIDGGKTQD